MINSSMTKASVPLPLFFDWCYDFVRRHQDYGWITYRSSDTQSIYNTGHQIWNLRSEMMVSQFELKIMSEIDPGSILPSGR